MKHLENIVRQFLNLEFTYEHMGSPGIEERLVKAKPTGYVYFKAEELLPIIANLEKELASD